MTEIERRAMRTGPFARGFLGAAVFLVLLCAGVLLAGWSLNKELNMLRSSVQDNVEWSVSQLEVDALRLDLAVQNARSGLVPASLVRRRFDILYSRVGIISRGDGFAALRTAPAVAARLAKVNAFLDRAVPFIDSPDEKVIGDIDRFASRMSAFRQNVRSLSTSGVRVLAQARMDRRDSFVDALFVSSLVALGLIVLLGVMLVVLDFQRRLAQRKTLESERNRKRLVATNEAALEAIIVADQLGCITDWNPGAEAIFGLPAHGAVGRKMSELIIPQRFRAAHEAGMARFLATGESRVIDAGRIELAALRSDGTEFPVELAIATTEADDGPIFISYMRDISERVQSQQDLTKARDDAMAGDRAKSRFLAVMSHEMRTPLNGILGLMDLLLHTDLTPEQRRHVDSAQMSGEVLLRHLNDVLDITRIEAGRLDLETRQVEMSDIVKQVLDIGRPLALANGNTISVRMDPDLKPVMGDPHRLRQTLLNLVGNAAKFARNGNIVVAAKVLDRQDDHVNVEISVFNTGVPIPPEDRVRIFDDFVTLDDTYARTNTGTGLGLAISKRVVQSMDGQIGLKDDVADGNCFWFSVPFTLAPGRPDEMAPRQDTPSAPTAGPFAPRRVLLIEDNDLNRQIVHSMLTDAGHTVVEAADGAAGVAEALRAPFDAILMDVSMPVMTGIEATEEIRRGGGPCRDVPIIGLTAHALPEEVQRFIGAGMQICLTKPVRRSALLTMIDQITAGVAERSVEDHTGTPLIDDDVFADFVMCFEDEKVTETLNRVVRELEHGMGDLKVLATGDDLEAVRSCAHKLSGTAAIVGARRLQGAFAKIEEAGGGGDARSLTTLARGTEPVLRATVTTLAEFASL